MPKAIDPVDRLVGANIRSLRVSQRLSQADLGRKIGVTFQQVQKYEKGMNRVGASRLQGIAAVLGVKPDAFFAGVPVEPGTAQVNPVLLLSDAYAIRLLVAFNRIENTRFRQSLVHLVEQVSQDPGSPTKRR